MKSLTHQLVHIARRLRQCVAAILGIAFDLRGLELDATEIADQLAYGRD
jgi:hypothetical protein